MSDEEASAIVSDALEVVPETSEFEELAKIHMASLTDWTVQLAHIVADQKWDRADNALIAANHALQKLAGVVSKLMEK